MKIVICVQQKQYSRRIKILQQKHSEYFVQMVLKIVFEYKRTI